jgi:hypothetical protein
VSDGMQVKPLQQQVIQTPWKEADHWVCWCQEQDLCQAQNFHYNTTPNAHDETDGQL